MIEKCIRCGKPTPYHPNTPTTLRRYCVEGSKQLASESGKLLSLRKCYGKSVC